MAETTEQLRVGLRARTLSGALPVVAFSVTMLVSAGLLFMVQPMFAKMILPLLGGTPAVWNTSMLFFQTALLLGYVYAHYSIKHLGVRRQIVVQVVLIGVSLLFLPIAVPNGWRPGGENPAMWLLALLTVALGLPFFVISTTSPTLQRWFAALGHRSSGDPYFLYAASNLGSMVALLSYPLLVEPSLRLADQTGLWSLGYLGFAVLAIGAGVITWRSGSALGVGAEVSERPVAQKPSVMRRVRWILLAFVPSSLMLGVTTYFTTDIAPIPLLWVIPLSLYLGTFIVVFSSRGERVYPIALRSFPVAIVALALAMGLDASRPMLLLIALHLLVFVAVALTCHGELARDRPHPGFLTDFYLCLALGGALGGAFNALIAPSVFDSLLEYPVVLVLSCLLVGGVREGARIGPRDLMVPLLVAGVVLVGHLIARQEWPTDYPTALSTAGVVVAGIVCLASAARRFRFGLAVTALLVAASVGAGAGPRVLFSDRSFFGVSKVFRLADEDQHLYIHGTTLHGLQKMAPSLAKEPMHYYHREGPLGAVFESDLGVGADPDVAVVGLGTGSMSCYAQPGQTWTFYELDPTVARVATDPSLFTYLRSCAEDMNIVLGDGRLSLQKASDGAYGLIAIDAFSSDSIPIHLITRDAVELYLDKLDENGVVLFHVSNRYLDLRPVLSNIAHSLELQALVGEKRAISNAEKARGVAPSVWVTMARSRTDLSALEDRPSWRALEPSPEAGLWTDDFSNLVGVMRFK
jgi:hypothetical protein